MCSPRPPPLHLTHCTLTLLLQLHSVTASSPPQRRHHRDKSQCHHASRLNAPPRKPSLMLFFSLLLCTPISSLPLSSLPSCTSLLSVVALSPTVKKQISPDSIIHWAWLEEATRDRRASAADLRRRPGWLFPHATVASIQLKASGEKMRGDLGGFKPVAPVCA